MSKNDSEEACTSCNILTHYFELTNIISKSGKWVEKILKSDSEEIHVFVSNKENDLTRTPELQNGSLEAPYSDLDKALLSIPSKVAQYSENNDGSLVTLRIMFTSGDHFVLENQHNWSFQEDFDYLNQFNSDFKRYRVILRYYLYVITYIVRSIDLCKVPQILIIE